ncbi:MAG: methyltransferase domain-containing protein [Gammaproteobacteria bacterium]|nr:methyltransferase domain-containing protein [Gammaproteobacteria bacterium]
MSDARGYVTDIAYTDAYYPPIATPWAAYVAAINGFPPPAIDAGYAYCELGCGNGMTLAILAAANPQAHFTGIDVNPEHITNARALAAAGGLTNIEFLACDLGEALKRPPTQPALQASAQPLGPFDFVTMHGLYTWVAPEVRADVIRFLDYKVKPGGLVAVSYNALPGWAGMQPLREMMLAYSAGVAADSLEKARRGIAYLDFMGQNDAQYFVNNPDARRRLDTLKKDDLRYVVHEYFSEHWTPLYFSEVAQGMAVAGLSFAGSFPLIENYQDAIPAPFRDLLRSAPDRAAWEVHKDFVRNTAFRRDVYVRSGAEARRPVAECLRPLCFGMFIPPGQMNYAGTIHDFSYDIDSPLHRAIVARLARSPAGVTELAADPALAGEAGGASAADIAAALQWLILSEQVGCFARPIERDAVQAGAARMHPLSRVLLERALRAGRPVGQAVSSAHGAALHGNWVHLLLLHGACEAGMASAARWATEWIADKQIEVRLATPGGQQTATPATPAQLRALFDANHAVMTTPPTLMYDFALASGMVEGRFGG